MAKQFCIDKILKNIACDHTYVSEEDFRIDFVATIKQIYDSALVLCEYSRPIFNDKIDVFVYYNENKYAIELKYLPAYNNFNYDKKFLIDGSYKRKNGSEVKCAIFKKGNNGYPYEIISSYNIDSYITDYKKLNDIKNGAHPIADEYYSIILTNYNRFNHDKCFKIKSKINKIKCYSEYLENFNYYYISI